MEKNDENQGKPVDWENIAKYKAAELENYIRRSKDAAQNAFNDGRTHVLLSILPLTDSLSEAIKTVQNENDRKGIEMLSGKFNDVLRNLGIEEIPVNIGDNFDPHIHSCIVTSETGENKVREVFAKGYKFAGRVVRPAMVKL